MVGGVIELRKDGQTISYDPSGKKEEGKEINFWQLLRTESGHTILAMDSAFSLTDDFPKVVEKFEMPMTIVLEGDQMTWNLLTRDELKPATPSEVAAYKFTRK